MMTSKQVNFDGLVGPTHHYGGLSYGNLPSMTHAGESSNPRKAALEGLAKMKTVSELGVHQALLPPAPRPNFSLARRLGFEGGTEEILDSLFRRDQGILSSIFSASSMWAANVATVSPSMDSRDGRVHVTPANLVSTVHRSQEANWHYETLKQLLSDPAVKVHEPLPSNIDFRDEGAANHMRVAPGVTEPGFQLFVYSEERGNSTLSSGGFPSRQTLKASESVARLHDIPEERTVFLKQNPAVLEAGGFHNDLVAVASANVLLYHERAFDNPGILRKFKSTFEERTGCQLELLEVNEEQISLEEAVKSYLFNSQLIPCEDGGMRLVAAGSLKDRPKARSVLEHLINRDNPIKSVCYVNLTQSMKNGGGPACLRLKTHLPERLVKNLKNTVLLTPSRHDKLESWIKSYYPQELRVESLGDPDLVRRIRRALDELESILNLEGLYDRSTL